MHAVNATAIALKHAPRGWHEEFKRDQARFIRDTVREFQPVAGLLAKSYADTLRERDYRAANQQLRAAAERLRVADFNLAMADDALVDWCEAKAKKGSAILSRATGTDRPDVIAAALSEAQAQVDAYGFPLPDPDDVGALPVIRRVADAGWWRRKARRLQAGEVERVAQLLRRVRKGREMYCADVTVARFKAQRVRNRRLLESLTATNEAGDSYTLAELSDLSTSNPKLRRGELMVRIRGFDTVAKECGHHREFFTLTTPSRFHPFTTAGNYLRPNPRHDGSTTTDATAYLNKVWARIRSALARRAICVYGFRVVEAHHDGTPHWHGVWFYEPEHRDTVREIVRRYALADSPDEPGAQQRRVQFEDVDDKKGDAASYLAKYITKALPADDTADLVQHDLYGEDNADSAERVGAWAWSNRVRQFQQIGGPSVTVWRELRRAWSDEAIQKDLWDAGQDTVYECARAADAADWAAFVMLMGGPTVPRKGYLLKAYTAENIDQATGEIKSQPLTRYGEIPKGRVMGLEVLATGDTIRTRWHTWTVGQDAPAPVAVEGTRLMAREVDTLLADLKRDAWAPWSHVWQLSPDYEHARHPERFCFSGGATAPPLESCQ